MIYRLGILVILFSLPAFARHQVTLLEKTASSKTISLNVGHIDGYKVRDHGAFFSRDGLEKLAVGELVKVYPNYSIWHLLKIYNVAALQIQKNYLLLTARETLLGAAHKPINSKIEVSPRSKNWREYPGRLAQRSDGYTKSLRPKDVEEVTEKREFERVEEDVWGIGASNMDLMAYEKIAAPTAELLTKKDDLQRLQTNLNQLPEKSKEISEVGGEDVFYKEQRRDPHINEVRDEAYFNRLRDLLAKFKAKKMERSQLLDELERLGGPNWSSSMSDEELSLVLGGDSIRKESQRQLNAIESYASEGVTLSYGYLKSVNSYNLSYEYFLGKKLIFMRPITIEASLNLADGLGVGGMLYYYLLTRPSAIGHNVYFAGIGMQQGASPTLRLGMRHNFYGGWGFRISAGMNSTNENGMESIISLGINYIF